MNKILLVGIGGFVGSALRYLVGACIQQRMKEAVFPWGTLAVNLLGCLVIGFLAQFVEARGALSDEARALIFVGVLGGFTTFSTFGNETLNLWRVGAGFAACVNVATHIVLGLGAVWLGRALAGQFWR